MNEIDEFLTFLYDNIEDDRIEVSKKMKYGFRHFSINIYLENTDESDTFNNLSNSTYNTTFTNKTYNSIQILIDCRNNCIELNVNMDDVVVENIELTQKWADLLEEYLNKKLEDKVSILINSGLSKTDLLREYKLKKIIKENESI
jgi:hypothetical protein